MISRLLKILQSGEIRLATLYVPPTEKPVVWFSYHQNWEPTATPADSSRPTRQLTFDELTEIETPARIEVDPQAAPLDWRSWRKLSGVKSKMIKHLEEIAIRRDADVKTWRMSFEPVKTSDFISVEVFANGKWSDFREFLSLK